MEKNIKIRAWHVFNVPADESDVKQIVAECAKPDSYARYCPDPTGQLSYECVDVLVVWAGDKDVTNEDLIDAVGAETER